MSDHNIFLNVLGYQEDCEWVALALEMDLRGYGATFEDAIQELQELVEMQMGFAHFKGRPDMIFHPADPVWFERFAEARRFRINEMFHARPEISGTYEVAGLPIPPAHIIASLQNSFTEAHA